MGRNLKDSWGSAYCSNALIYGYEYEYQFLFALVAMNMNIVFPQISCIIFRAKCTMKSNLYARMQGLQQSVLSIPRK